MIEAKDMAHARCNREISPREHDAAVRTVLRLAARKNSDVTEVGVVCDALGLSLSDALARSEGAKV